MSKARTSPLRISLIPSPVCSRAHSISRDKLEPDDTNTTPRPLFCFGREREKVIHGQTGLGQAEPGHTQLLDSFVQAHSEMPFKVHMASKAPESPVP